MNNRLERAKSGSNTHHMNIVTKICPDVRQSHSVGRLPAIEKVVCTMPSEREAAAKRRDRTLSLANMVQDAGDDGRHRTAALAALIQQAPNCKFSIRYMWRAASEAPTITLGLEQLPGPATPRLDEARLKALLDMWVHYLWPGAKLTGRLAAPLPLLRRPIVPEVFDHWEPKAAGPSPALVPAIADASLLEQTPWRQLELTGALALLPKYAPAELVISIAPFFAEARHLRCLQDLMQSSRTRGGKSSKDEARNDFLRNLGASGQALRIGIQAGFAEEVDPIVYEQLSYTLFGCASDSKGFSATRADLRCLWPLGNALPQLLIEPPTIAAERAMPNVNLSAPGALLLDHSIGEQHDVGLSATDRARHIYAIGSTGSGKSTFLLNLMAQDMASGEGLILIDPHGDLAEEVRRIVPADRQNDLIWCDFADPTTIKAINILEMTGLDPEIERSIIANQLVDLFKSILYRDVDAFGPMFDQYFRNGLMLLMCGAGKDASLMDFERVFHDEQFRMELLHNCDNAKVKEFWEDIVDNVSGSVDHSLGNMTPYITCKLAQLTGNPLVRRFVSARRSELDLRAAMNEGRIVLIRIAKGITGEYDAKLIATLLSMRIMQAGMARAAMPPADRRPCRFYFDEFQNAHGKPLATILAEARKYGISVTIANQSLGQVTGRAGNDDAGDAALANAANLIVFRIGAMDAASLAPWLQPEVTWHDLMRLPDFHAVTRILANGRPVPPLEITTLPPPV